jgi:hemolysin activation/secretion protein
LCLQKPVGYVKLLLSFPASAKNAPSPQAVSQAQNNLVLNIKIEGFVLDDKARFDKLFKPYRNKHLFAADIDALLQQLQEIYEQAGY